MGYLQRGTSWAASSLGLASLCGDYRGVPRGSPGTGWVLSLEPLHWAGGGGRDRTHALWGVCGQRRTQLTDMAQPPRVSRGRPTRSGCVPCRKPLSWVRGRSPRCRLRPGQEGGQKCSQAATLLEYSVSSLHEFHTSQRAGLRLVQVKVFMLCAGERPEWVLLWTLAWHLTRVPEPAGAASPVCPIAHVLNSIPRIITEPRSI